MTIIEDKLRRYQAVAELRHRSGAAEVDYVTLRDAASEIDRLRLERDEARKIAINLYRFLSHHEAVPEICDEYKWLIDAVTGVEVV